MELPNRKPNRLETYDYSQNGVYFITVCTQDRKKILSQIVGDGFPVPTSIGLIAEEYICRIKEKYLAVFVDRYVIMPDHIHMLIRIDRGTGNPSPTLGNVVGWYKYQVTKNTNLHMDMPGARLFQRSYYDHVIRNQQDYDEIWEYIDNNPRKWLLKKNDGD
ncbi:MAG: transposase [Oscillospiraceae bacterium]|nr:transposase [Oscillospiraceae bacterium]